MATPTFPGDVTPCHPPASDSDGPVGKGQHPEHARPMITTTQWRIQSPSGSSAFSRAPALAWPSRFAEPGSCAKCRLRASPAMTPPRHRSTRARNDRPWRPRRIQYIVSTPRQRHSPAAQPDGRSLHRHESRLFPSVPPGKCVSSAAQRSPAHGGSDSERRRFNPAPGRAGHSGAKVPSRGPRDRLSIWRIAPRW